MRPIIVVNIIVVQNHKEMKKSLGQHSLSRRDV